MQDLELIRAAQAGDRSAMERLLTIARPDIRRYARYQCEGSTMVDDVVQEAMIVIYRRLGTMRNVAAFSGWVARIVLRLCMAPAMMFRKTETIESIGDTIDFSVKSEHDVRIDLARAIESLPPHYRDVMMMRDFEELMISEIAQRLSITVEATKSRIHRARAMVREYLLSEHNAQGASKQ